MPELDVALFTNKKRNPPLETKQDGVEFVRPILRHVIDGSHLYDTSWLPFRNPVKTQLLWPLRIAITGRAATPGGAFEMAYLLAKDENDGAS